MHLFASYVKIGDINILKGGVNPSVPLAKRTKTSKFTKLANRDSVGVIQIYRYIVE